MRNSGPLRRSTRPRPVIRRQLHVPQWYEHGYGGHQRCRRLAHPLKQCVDTRCDQGLADRDANKIVFPVVNAVIANGVSDVANKDVFAVGAGYLDI